MAKVTWLNDITKLNAQNLNEMSDNIETVSKTANQNSSAITTINDEIVNINRKLGSEVVTPDVSSQLNSTSNIANQNSSEINNINSDIENNIKPKIERIQTRIYKDTDGGGGVYLYLSDKTLWIDDTYMPIPNREEVDKARFEDYPSGELTGTLISIKYTSDNNVYYPVVAVRRPAWRAGCCIRLRAVSSSFFLCQG